MSLIRVQVTHGTSKHDIDVTNPTGGDLTVSHLAREVARVTEVPINGQKLICKGKSLTDQFASLRSVGVKNNSKIMLLGKKVNQAQDANVVAISKVDKNFAKTEERLGELSKEFDGIKNGFLPTNLAPDALKKLGLQVGICSEEFTRGLESLDALVLAEAAPEIRQRRKNLVQKIQKMLDTADKIRSDVREEQSRR